MATQTQTQMAASTAPSIINELDNTVALQRSETEPFGLNWTSYSTPALHDIVTDSIKELTALTRRGQKELRQRLLPALQEVRSRINKGEAVDGYDTMKAYLAAVGLSEGVIRQWEFRFREKTAAPESKRSFRDTISDQDTGEIIAAIQGEIRRGMEKEAVQHARQMEGTKAHRTWIWNRLSVIASEDIGLANVDAVGKIAEYRTTYEKAAASNNPNQPETLFLCQAVTYLCRSPKSRIVDNLIHVVKGEALLPPAPIIDIADVTVPPLKVTPIPDWVNPNGHMADGAAYFHDVKARLENCTLYDPYAVRAREVDIALENQPTETTAAPAVEDPITDAMNFPDTEHIPQPYVPNQNFNKAGTRGYEGKEAFNSFVRSLVAIAERNPNSPFVSKVDAAFAECDSAEMKGVAVHELNRAIERLTQYRTQFETTKEPK